MICVSASLVRVKKAAAVVAASVAAADAVADAAAIAAATVAAAVSAATTTRQNQLPRSHKAGEVVLIFFHRAEK